ncbi:MAG: acyl carrier protein [Oculatellaceae cyanobacterium bins.114]|nr:acyl carrier protein [Oculatellaceae cyanobacterium bins.114]
MNRESVLESIESIFREVLNNSHISINENTTGLDIEEWNSLTHLNLILAVEKKFQIKFKLTELATFKKIGDIIDVLLGINSEKKM